MKGLTNEKPKLSLWTLIALGLSYYCVNFLWRVEDASIIPYAQKLGVPVKFSSMIWLGSPVLSFIVANIIGKISDSCTFRYGRRRIFIVILAVCTTIGGITIVTLPNFSAAVFPNNEQKAKVLRIVLLFISFIIADGCTTSILTPGRALLLDLTPSSQIPSANAFFALLGQIGGVLAFSIGALPLGKGFEFLGIEPHLRVLFCVAYVNLWVSIVIQLVLIKEDPLVKPGLTQDKTKKKSRKRCSCKFSWPLLILVTISTVGWLALLTQAIFWTTWWGDRKIGPLFLSFVGLALQALFAMATSYFVPKLNALLGVKPVFYIGEVLLILSMISFSFVQNAYAASCVLIVSGASLAIRDTNMFVLLKSFTRPKMYGAYTGILNSSINFAQIIVASFGGIILDALDEKVPSLYFTVGVFSLCASCSVMIIDVACGNILKPDPKAHQSQNPKKIGPVINI